MRNYRKPFVAGSLEQKNLEETAIESQVPHQVLMICVICQAWISPTSADAGDAR